MHPRRTAFALPLLILACSNPPSPTSPCDSDARQCFGRHVHRCEAGEWIPETFCDAVCSDGACRSGCTPGETHCSADGNLETCTTDGKTFEPSGDCAGSCTGGVCQPNPTTCTPGETECTNRTHRQCDTNGAWQAQECASAGACHPDGCLLSSEDEAPNVRGANDTFDSAQPLPLNTDFQGHIGALGDEDHYSFAVPETGTVTISVEFNESIRHFRVTQMSAILSINEGSVADFMVTGFSNTRVDDCIDYGNGTVCVDRFTITYPVYAEAGRYTLKITGSGDPERRIPGFDPENPYHLRVDYHPGGRLEHEPESDATLDLPIFAQPLKFDETGRAQTTGYGAYWQDKDWYTFEMEERGWFQILQDTRAAEDEDNTSIALWLNTSVFYEEDGALVQLPNARLTSSESPNGGVDELYALPMDRPARYFIRTTTPIPNPAAPYHLHIERGFGGGEDAEPSAIGYAGVPRAAHDAGTVEANQTQEVEGYCWRHGDRDWVRYTIPANTAGTLRVELDYQDSWTENGTHNRRDNPFGVRTYLFLFDQAWFDGDQNRSEFLASSTEGSDRQSVEWSVEAQPTPQTFYSLISCRGHQDRNNPYAHRVFFTAQPEL